MTWYIAHRTLHLVKRSFHSPIFSHLRILPLILHRATTRLLLLVREKELPISTFLNIYVVLNETNDRI